MSSLNLALMVMPSLPLWQGPAGASWCSDAQKEARAWGALTPIQPRVSWCLPLLCGGAALDRRECRMDQEQLTELAGQAVPKEFEFSGCPCCLRVPLPLSHVSVALPAQDLGLPPVGGHPCLVTFPALAPS